MNRGREDRYGLKTKEGGRRDEKEDVIGTEEEGRSKTLRKGRKSEVEGESKEGRKKCNQH